MSTSVYDTPFNIIIADDHPIFRKGLASTLRNISFIHSIAQAADGNEVLYLLKTGTYALVLLDINMAGMDGKTAAPLIHKQYPEVKIIVISMIDDGSTIRHMYQVGCHGYLIKNSDESEIIKAIGTVMGGRKYFADDIMDKVVQEPDENDYSSTVSEHSLSATEIKLIQLICAGKSNKQIANELKYAIRTVENYRAKLYEKTGVVNTADLVRYALRNNIISA